MFLGNKRDWNSPRRRAVPMNPWQRSSSTITAFPRFRLSIVCNKNARELEVSNKFNVVAHRTGREAALAKSPGKRLQGMTWRSQRWYLQCIHRRLKQAWEGNIENAICQSFGEMALRISGWQLMEFRLHIRVERVSEERRWKNQSNWYDGYSQRARFSKSQVMCDGCNHNI